MALNRYLKMNLPEGQSAFLWGARKTGKSTFLKQQYPDSLYIDFLDSETLHRYTQKPYLLREIVEAFPIERRKLPIILDEVQKVPQILNDVHWLIENRKPTSFILCGSSARALRRQGVNLLGGRAWRYVFCPLAFPEIEALDLVHIFKTGLLPAHYLDPQNIKMHMRAYVHDYLGHEVQQESVIRNMGAFLRFLELMAFCHTEIINYANLARDCAVDAKTIKGYFEILEDMLLGSFIHPFFERSKRDHLVAHPKFYFFDVGVANFIARKEVTEVRGSEAGKMFEHYLFMELYAYKHLNLLDHSINYWRTKSGHEVDFILNDGKLAIECKISDSIQKRDLSGLLAFKKDFPESQLLLVCLEPYTRVTIINDVNVKIYPLRNFLTDLWSGNILN
jgi:predicted AAA+ superfamily ATPase